MLLFVHYLIFSDIFSVRNFISYAHGTKNRHRKMESIYGADFWSVCYGPKLNLFMLCIWLSMVGLMHVFTSPSFIWNFRISNSVVEFSVFCFVGCRQRNNCFCCNVVSKIIS